MHAVDMLTYGHQTVAEAVEGLNESEWEQAGVCGHWSVKEIIAHLASYEVVLVEILQTILEPGTATPQLEQLLTGYETFNDEQVLRRQAMTAAEQWHEYETAQQQVMVLLRQVPQEKQRQAGILDWYGPDYDLEDFLVYMYYAHKREHAAQIHVYRDQLARAEAI
ncbi:MAG: hypothetical protein CL608_32310 [Anaerolineaceae bacterium]|nr:hypothetical protein [Anaerolineaceae bacterium]